MATTVAILVYVGGAGAQTKEGAGQLIEKARVLTLQKDRLKASQVLVQGIDRFGKVSKEGARLLKELNELSGLFYEDRVQKLFELAESLYFSKNPLATERYKEALEIEPYNRRALLGLARAHLAKSNCESAKETLLRAREVQPFDEDVKELSLQVGICVGSSGPEEALPSGLTPTASRTTASGQLRLLQGDLVAAKKLFKKSITLGSDYPEAYFGLLRVGELENQLAIEEGKKYLLICKSVSPTLMQKYKNDPLMCGRVKYVEAYLEKNLESQE